MSAALVSQLLMAGDEVFSSPASRAIRTAETGIPVGGPGCRPQAATTRSPATSARCLLECDGGQCARSCRWRALEPALEGIRSRGQLLHGLAQLRLVSSEGGEGSAGDAIAETFGHLVRDFIRLS